ncbi:MAG: aldo/keto reductase [Oscillospiraceae bacterium]|nr:aldo/keto reductase [Oscillospiraceae bacterium]
MEYVTLNNGVKMPIVGYGVNKLEKGECENCVLNALEAGYRLIDTAQAYENEAEIGSAIKKSGVPREEIFITTKIRMKNYGYEKCRASVLESLENLGTDYIDLVLIHQPFGDYYGAYHALEEFYEQGIIKAIGISNFYPDKMVDIASFAKVKPAVNQVEIHPYNQQIESKKWHDKYEVQMEAWAPFGQGRVNMFELPELENIARRYKKSVAQIILRWHIQRGIVAIPRTRNIERMKENLDVFDFRLIDSDMERISRIDRDRSLFYSHTDPITVEWFAQKFYRHKNK